MGRRSVQEDPGGGRTEFDEIPVLVGSVWNTLKNGHAKRPAIEAYSVEEAGTLVALLRDVFLDHWGDIVFGTLIEGSVFELKLPERPTVFSMLDGYLTVEIPPGPGHFHLCLGETHGLGKTGTPPEQARARRCARAAFVRSIASDGCTPRSWGIRLWNGKKELMLAVFLPSPYYGTDFKPLKKPDWSRLALWDKLRAKYLGETEPQPVPDTDAIPMHG